MIIFIYSILINILLRTTNRNSIPTMYFPHIPNFLKVVYRVPKLVPRNEDNCESDDYVLK